MRRRLLLISSGLLAVMGSAVVCGQQQEPRPEVTLSDKEIARLDIFEDRALSEADAAFDRQQYVAARTKYDDFLKQYSGSAAAAYALLKKGRCADLAGQPAEAVADYQAVADRFPKMTKYAVPALCYAAECHLAGGARDAAIAAWSRLAENVDYRRAPLGAEAIRRLVETVAGQGSPDEVIAYYERLGLDWRGDDDPIAQQAIKAIVRQHVRTAPDEAKLREFYKRLHPDAPERPEESVGYWSWIVRCIQENGTFGYYERDARKEFHDHWLGVMQGQFPESEDYQIALATLQLGADGDRNKFAERMDALFEKGRKEGDWHRILKWVRAYKGNWTKTREYAAMVDYKTAGIEGIGELMDLLCNEQNETYVAKSAFGKFCEDVPFDELPDEAIWKLISIARDILQDSTAARSLTGKLHFEKMTEQAKLALARKYLAIDAAIARQIYDQLADRDAGKLELFEHYVKTGDTQNAISLAGELAEVEKYAEEFALKKAELLEAGRRYSEAITAYRQCGSEPKYQWRIVGCYQKMERPDQAIEQLRAIQAEHQDQAAKAAYRIASLYDDVEQKEEKVAMLRELVRKYPNSEEGEKARNELGELGVPPTLPTEPSLDF